MAKAWHTSLDSAGFRTALQVHSKNLSQNCESARIQRLWGHDCIAWLVPHTGIRAVHDQVLHCRVFTLPSQTPAG